LSASAAAWVAVPVLYEVFRVLGVPDAVHMQLCIGTSLAIMTRPIFARTRRIARPGAVLTDVVRQWTPGAIAGIAIGAAVATVAPSPVFKIAFVVLGGDHRGKAPLRTGIVAAGRRPAAASARAPLRRRGRADGFFDRRQRRIALHHGAHALRKTDPPGGRDLPPAIVVPITIAGTLGYVVAGLPQQGEMPPLSIGFVSLIGFALMAPLASVTAPWGARMAHALSRRALEIAFALFLLAAALRFLVSLVW
jgi:uncharacterized membrane protein YfcA